MSSIKQKELEKYFESFATGSDIKLNYLLESRGPIGLVLKRVVVNSIYDIRITYLLTKIEDAPMIDRVNLNRGVEFTDYKRALRRLEVLDDSYKTYVRGRFT